MGTKKESRARDLDLIGVRQSDKKNKSSVNKNSKRGIKKIRQDLRNPIKSK
jgi:hypothetical protein